jgi:hypothetical protein
VGRVNAAELTVVVTTVTVLIGASCWLVDDGAGGMLGVVGSPPLDAGLRNTNAATVSTATTTAATMAASTRRSTDQADDFVGCTAILGGIPGLGS